ncbi:aminotransferase class I/II-fold pyridoxal phosphate-dependent enzyme [Arthrobacter sp. JZ12]|uniref:MalY/PatB family protein n=1 Tax=Arthrobacter sp. JZ12 TaxID=2654190 RepID=UPI002B466C33|nr:aminotransferase class I/II-fold pyridoxal phosphate-dependent enzyme [Arthrobacter sp. JZ12]WRH26016.1 aminotransferase class I/II-fold pyridoxal phosphate-dependent enzyme [Arthrobacter sp. JZ12]
MNSIPNPLEDLTLGELRQRTSLKWRTYPEDVLPLWVAEMDVRLAEPVARVLTHAVARGDTGYPYGTAYAEALAAFAERRWRWSGVDPARTALVPDVMLGIVEVLRLVTEPGSTVVINTPVYPPFFAFVEHSGRKVHTASLNDAGRVDLDALEEAFRAARAQGEQVAYLISNPHNPTGVVHTRAELEGIAALARTYGVRVVADEIHSPLILPGAEFTPYLSVAGGEDAFAVVSASKAWNLAGLKAALVVAGPEAAADLRRLPEEVGHGPSHLGILAHTAALKEGERWLDALIGGLAANRDLLRSLLAEHLPDVGFRAPEGTYLAWLDCRRLSAHYSDGEASPGVVSDLAGPARFFLDHARVALSSGHVFGEGGAGHVRLNYATSSSILTEAVARMGAAVARSEHASGPR